MAQKGILIVVSGPSGSGKGTVLSKAFELDDSLYFSVSATTRPPREGETDGVNYHFVSREIFEQYIEKGAVVEHTYYSENYYGTLVSETAGKCEEGRDVILEIEVDGAMQIKKKFPDSVLVMMVPPDYKTLESRLRLRGTNTEDDIRRRLDRALEELKFYDKYDYLIVNRDGEIDSAAKKLISIISSEHSRVSREPEFPEQFLNQ